ncbi:MAG: ATP synthase F1 subunit delta [Thermoanaerobaculales bacterium]|jgi:F-type H+-transporting ATPase subunit delta|nr:ATP synthase F1 subunit delta [Thermoanaerobaculales bacterium]
MSRFRAQPYAKALLEVLRTEGSEKIQGVIESLDSVATALETVPEFERVMVTPTVDPETKTKILDQVLDSLEITEPVRRFVHVVQSNYRLQHMRDIATCYRDFVDRELGRTRARIEVAAAYDEADRRRIAEVMSAVMGATVVADFVHKPDLLAGFKVQVGSKVFDGSLVGQVDRLSRQTVIEQG